MTTHKSRHLPHPILEDQGQDYQDHCKYGVPEKRYSLRLEEDQVKIFLQHQLKCPSLEELVKNGQAQYATILRNRGGRQRVVHTSPIPEQRIAIPKAEYPGQIFIEPNLTAAKPLLNWRAPDWNPDLYAVLPNGVNLEPGALLAIGASITCNTNQLLEAPSPIVMVQSNEVGPRHYFDLHGDQIKIKLNRDAITAINQLRNNPQLKETLFPLWEKAFIHALGHCEQEEYRNYPWAKSLNAALAQESELDPPLNPDREERQIQLRENAYLYAQTLLENPLHRFTDTLQRFMEQDSLYD